MAILKLWTRSFHSQKNFGAGGLFFNGDGRGFSSSEGVTARIHNLVVIDLPSASIVEKRCFSSPSSHPVGMHQDYSSPKLQPRTNQQAMITPYRKDGDQQANIFVTYAGQNFAFPGADTNAGHAVYGKLVPDLDVTNSVNIRIDRTGHKIHATCRLAGDGFPDAESFMLDSNGQALFLASHVRVGSAIGQLPGGRAIAMGSTALEVDWTPDDAFGAQVKCLYCIDYSCDCSPTDVKALMPSNPCDRASWNKVHEGRDPGGSFMRKLLDQLPGAHDSGRPAWTMP